MNTQKTRILNPTQRITRKQKKLSIQFRDELDEININESIINEMDALNSEYYDAQTNTVLQPFFGDDKKVKPVYRYLIKKNEQSLFELYAFIERNSDFNSSTFNDYPINIETEIESIVILLESPHKDEFNDDYQPISLAQGKTGDQIEAKICELFNRADFSNVLVNDQYRIIIVNPIPYQTSLYALHHQSISGVYKTLRDKVWSVLWENHEVFRQEFKNCIDQLNPILLVNCCTSALKDKIDLSSFTCHKFKIDHPSSWWKGLDNIRIEAV